MRGEPRTSSSSKPGSLAKVSSATHSKYRSGTCHSTVRMRRYSFTESFFFFQCGLENVTYSPGYGTNGRVIVPSTVSRRYSLYFRRGYSGPGTCSMSLTVYSPGVVYSGIWWKSVSLMSVTIPPPGGDFQQRRTCQTLDHMDRETQPARARASVAGYDFYLQLDHPQLHNCRTHEKTPNAKPKNQR